MTPARCHTAAWLTTLRWAEQGLRGVPSCQRLGQCTARIWGRGQRVTWNQPTEMGWGPAREHTPLISRKGVLSQQRLDPESHQHQDEGSGFYFLSRKGRNDFFLIQLSYCQKMFQRKIVTCPALPSISWQAIHCPPLIVSNVAVYANSGKGLDGACHKHACYLFITELTLQDSVREMALG